MAKGNLKIVSEQDAVNENEEEKCFLSDSEKKKLIKNLSTKASKKKEVLSEKDLSALIEMNIADEDFVEIYAALSEAGIQISNTDGKNDDVFSFDEWFSDEESGKSDNTDETDKDDAVSAHYVPDQFKEEIIKIKEFHNSRKYADLSDAEFIEKTRKEEISIEDFLLRYGRTVLCLLRKRNWVFTNSGTSQMDPMDLVQEGRCGLLDALKRYDDSKMAGFSTFAYYWIDKKMRQYVDKVIHPIHIPDAVLRKCISLNKELTELEKNGISNPTYEIYRKHYKTLNEKEFNMCSGIAFSMMFLKSLNQVLNSEDDTDDTQLIDVLRDTHGRYSSISAMYAKKETLEKIAACFRGMDELTRSATIMSLGLGPDEQPMNERDIARKLGIKPAFCHELIVDGTEKLRDLADWGLIE